MKRARLLTLLVTVGACSSSPPKTAVAPAPNAGAGLTVRGNWRSTVIVERQDSILLVLPSGAHQLQHFHRIAGLTLSVGGDGVVSVRVDSLRTVPTSAADTGAVGAVWTGRLGDPAIDALRPAAGSRAVGELTSIVRHLLPRLPPRGATPPATWRDSATGPTSTDVFKVTERRTAAWSTGRVSGTTVPIRVAEEFEQIGAGSQDYRRITVTSQGRRSGTYYLLPSGKIVRAELIDSSAVSIGVPANKEVMSGTRVTRTAIRFIPLRGEQ